MTKSDSAKIQYALQTKQKLKQNPKTERSYLFVRNDAMEAERIHNSKRWNSIYIHIAFIS